jgi:hypothetical protein
MKIPARFLKLIFFAAVYAIAASHASAQLVAPSITIDANNVNANLNILGDNFDNLATSKAGFEVPKNSGKNTIYASSLWLGGYQNNTLKVAAMTYRQSGLDFFPGPLDTANATTDNTRMKNWNQFWKVTRAEINNFKQNGTISASIANWPGNGIGNGETKQMAPYIDVDHDHIYDPKHGDYPDIKGDQMVWWVFNDNGGVHTESKSEGMGLEIQASAFEYSSTKEAINNTLFLDYKIINRSKTDISKLFIGLWTDFDLGYAYDDYVGAAPKMSAYYAYNGATRDIVYGTNPPIQSVIFMKDSMSRFLYYNNTANTTNGNPGFPIGNPKDYYNYLSGVWKNGDCMKYGQDGVKGTQCVNYMFDGDPSDSTKGWTEHNVGNTPGDRRGLGSIGPFDLKAGETFHFPFAYVFSQKENGNTATNFEQLKGYWTEVRQFYKSNYGSIDEADQLGKKLKLYPNPASDNIFIEFSNDFIEKAVLLDNTGREIKVIVSGKGQNSRLQLDISGLANGIYTVMASTKQGIAVSKLVVAK